MAKDAVQGMNLDQIMTTLGWGVVVLVFLTGLTVSINIFMNKNSLSGIKIVLESMKSELFNISQKVKSESELRDIAREEARLEFERKIEYHKNNCPLLKKQIGGKG